MEISVEEIEDIKNFIFLLNSKQESVVVVEGKNDEQALRKLGFSGNCAVFHKYNGIIKFSDSVSKYTNLIMLLDRDRKGRYLSSRIIEQVERRTKIDFTFQKKLAKITKGKIKCVEDLKQYAKLI